MSDFLNDFMTSLALDASVEPISDKSLQSDDSDDSDDSINLGKPPIVVKTKIQKQTIKQTKKQLENKEKYNKKATGVNFASYKSSKKLETPLGITEDTGEIPYLVFTKRQCVFDVWVVQYHSGKHSIQKDKIGEIRVYNRKIKIEEIAIKVWSLRFVKYSSKYWSLREYKKPLGIALEAYGIKPSAYQYALEPELKDQNLNFEVSQLKSLPKFCDSWVRIPCKQEVLWAVKMKILPPIE